jgi:hypothetical protein
MIKVLTQTKYKTVYLISLVTLLLKTLAGQNFLKNFLFAKLC